MPLQRSGPRVSSSLALTLALTVGDDYDDDDTMTASDSMNAATADTPET